MTRADVLLKLSRGLTSSLKGRRSIARLEVKVTVTRLLQDTAESTSLITQVPVSLCLIHLLQLLCPHTHWILRDRQIEQLI